MVEQQLNGWWIAYRVGMSTPQLRLQRFATSLLSSLLVLGLPAAPVVLLSTASAQTLTTGSLSGTVVDSSGAVVPSATVILTDNQGGTKRQVKTDNQGRFSFPLLRPATYAVEASAPGLTSSPVSVAVQVGASAAISVSVSPSGGSQNVTVSANAIPLTDTQSPSLITSFTAQQIQSLPAPGGDITTVAFTAPGVVTNNSSGYGNFSVDGLPGISNLYVINGFDEEDPFLNLNNSGSSNLTLGQAEIAEASVVVNGYSSQYGRQAGAIVEYTTKSGSNQIHGQANYYYNGDALNANDWFRNYGGEGRERAISNEWAANAGFPIIKDKLFGFVDYEGLRYVLPNAGQAVFPSPQLEAYTLATIPAASVPFYQQAFNLYNTSSNYKLASPVTNGLAPLQDGSNSLGCGTNLTGTPDGQGGVFGVNAPCALAGEGNASNINKEYLLTTRVDWNVSNRQRLFGRFKLDRGTQPTATSFTSPLFNETSTQPSYEGQLNDTIQISPNLTNQFIFAANWYTAYFGPADLASTLSAFPTFLSFGFGVTNGSSIGALGINNAFPQGRNVTQYQFVDDLSWVRGNHTMQFGYDFRREDLSDYDAQSGAYGAYVFNSLADFVGGKLAGTSSLYNQTFATQKTAYLALYNLGAYLQDNWQATPRLHLTYGVRFDRNGNPLCNNNCFARYNGGFPQAAGDTTGPYSDAITAGRANPYASVEAVIAQGRFGFNYAVTPDGHTVVRGGVGLFADTVPGISTDAFVQNFPQLYSATVQTGNVGASTTAGTAANNAVLSNAAIQAGFVNGETEPVIQSAVAAQGGAFTAPNFVAGPTNFREPKYLEFNLQVQKQFDANDAVVVGYVGNTGYDEFIENPLVNGMNTTGAPFNGLNANSADPRFATVTTYNNQGNSNYNALEATYKHHDARGLDIAVNYVYSHTLDDISNGGLPSEPYNNLSGYGYNVYSINTAADPGSLSALNYSNADYDIRQNVNANYTYQMPYFKRYGNIVNSALGGWLFAGKTYWHSGTPFSIVDTGLAGTAGGNTLGGVPLLATLLPGATVRLHCDGNGIKNPCVTSSDFAVSGSETSFGNLRRNVFFGPHYADSDFALSKKFVDTERFNIQIGTYAFNVFNHPNFSTPANNIGGGGNIGQSASIVAPPTSPYGSFSSAGVGGRVLQVFGKVTF